MKTLLLMDGELFFDVRIIHLSDYIFEMITDMHIDNLYYETIVYADNDKYLLIKYADLVKFEKGYRIKTPLKAMVKKVKNFDSLYAEHLRNKNIKDILWY